MNRDYNGCERSGRRDLGWAIRLHSPRPVRVQGFDAQLILSGSLAGGDRQLSKVVETFDRSIAGAGAIERQTIRVVISCNNVARVAHKTESRDRGDDILPRRIVVVVQQARDDVNALHLLGSGTGGIGEVGVAIDSPGGLRIAARGIQSGERGDVVHLWDGRIRIAEADGNAIHRIQKVHDRKAGVVCGGRLGVVGEHVVIGLRPAQAKDAAEDAHQPILHIRQLRVGGSAHPVDDRNRMNNIATRREIVGTTINGISETIVFISGALAEERVCDGPVEIVDDAERRTGGGRGDVGGRGDDAKFPLNVAAVDVFSEMAGLRYGQADAGRGSPGSDGGGDKNVGLRVGENRAQVALIGEVLDGSARPEDRLAFDSGVVAGARDPGRASSAEHAGEQQHERWDDDQKDWWSHNRLRRGVHRDSPRAARMARSSCETGIGVCTPDASRVLSEF